MKQDDPMQIQEPLLMLSRRGLIMGGAALMAAGTLGLPRGAAAQSAPAGQAIIGFSQEVTVLHPLMSHNEVDQGVFWNLYSTLWAAGPDGTLVPVLAKALPTVENGGLSADGMTWRIELRDDVKWHDGTPLTAADIKFTIELVQNPEFRAQGRNGYTQITDIAVEGDHVITWKLKEAFAPLISVLGWMFVVPSHILSKVADPNDPAFAAAPVGTGPYVFAERQTGNYVSLKANPDYFGTPAYLDTLIFKYIPDLNAMYTQFKTGEIDYIGLQGIPANFYDEAKSLPDRAIYEAPRGAIENLTLNLSHPALSDKAVREALYMAIDKTAIIDLVYYGVHKPAATFLSSAHWAYNPDLAPHEYDLKKAAAHLDSAGWVIGADGIRVKDGVRLSFSNSTTTGNQLRAETQQLLADDFKKIGVEMTINNMVAAVLWADFWKNSEFDSLMTGTVYTIAADPDVTHRFGSAAIPLEVGSGSNVSRYKNPALDALLLQGRTEFDHDKRKAIYFQVQAMIRADLPFLPLFDTIQLEGTVKGLDGYAYNMNTLCNTWNAASWKKTI
ncbi:MAG TPA: peptide ABC transporter substrate-binding protein [Paenirhodobacter sp.]